MTIKVEIWSDVACPWCYLGKHRFESGLAQFAHRDQVEVIWRSYQLDPDAPRTTDKTLDETLAEKHGMSLAQATALNEQMTEMAAKEGLDYHFERTRYSNSFDAHRLIQLARLRGRQSEIEERLFKAYFTEGKTIGDTDTLVGLAVDAGLDAEEARAVLMSDTHADDVRADIERGARLGIRGVPFFVIDSQYGVSGAQSPQAFQQALQQVWTETHPLVSLGDPSDGSVCVGDSCAV